MDSLLGRRRPDGHRDGDDEDEELPDLTGFENPFFSFFFLFFLSLVGSTPHRYTCGWDTEFVKGCYVPRSKVGIAT